MKSILKFHYFYNLMQQSLLFVPTRCAFTDNSMSLFLLISSVETWWMHSLKEVQTIAVLNCHHRPMAMYLSVVPLIPTKPIGLLCLVVMFLYFVGSVLLITDRGCRFSTFKLLECHSVQCCSFCCVTPGHAFISVPSLFFVLSASHCPCRGNCWSSLNALF